jgi:hypothetical protein
MPALKLALWAVFALLGAVALAHVAGLVNPQEKVNGLWSSSRRLSTRSGSIAAGLRRAWSNSMISG